MAAFSRMIVSLLMAGLIGFGCKDRTKSQPSSAAAEPTEAQPSGSAPAVAAATDPKTALHDASTALARHDLEKATVGLLQVGFSSQSLSESERAAYQGSMRDLQVQLAEAAARNDPKATEMIQLLKASRAK